MNALVHDRTAELEQPFNNAATSKKARWLYFWELNLYGDRPIKFLERDDSLWDNKRDTRNK